MKSKLKYIAASIFAILAICVAPTAVQAQLTDEMRSMFEQMMDELDEDLQIKFRKALVDGDNSIQFTPDEFQRFRDNPVNPFDGIQDIDPDALDGNIELKFELPSLRNRKLEEFERQQPELLNSFEPVVQSHVTSVVEIWKSGEKVCLGVVVDSEGLIMTKASELGDKEELHVVLHDRTTLSGKVVRTDSTNDLSVIQVARGGLTPIQFSNKQPRSGAFVITAGSAGSVMAVGAYSAPPRALAGNKQGFLGVKPQTAANGDGVLLVEVTPGGGGEAAGLLQGDVIKRLAGQPMNDVTALVNEIRNHQPGDSVEIDFARNGRRMQTRAVLADRNFSGDRAARFKMMNRLGAIPSDRADKFPWVFQHDTPLFPEQCGGPILDIDGDVIGINIARGGRAASYAIPSAHINKILADLLRENVASRN